MPTAQKKKKPHRTAMLKELMGGGWGRRGCSQNKNGPSRKGMVHFPRHLTPGPQEGLSPIERDVWERPSPTSPGPTKCSQVFPQPPKPRLHLQAHRSRDQIKIPLAQL
jgi:hypothetical protein